ncbi:hypothetical protein CI102_6020 [Trichoderma harzianum]|nr:hypothetical protein CI102_6020 [Trichoderma harzianum]
MAILLRKLLQSLKLYLISFCPLLGAASNTQCERQNFPQNDSSKEESGLGKSPNKAPRMKEAYTRTCMELVVRLGSDVTSLFFLVLLAVASRQVHCVYVLHATKDAAVVTRSVISCEA